MADQDINLLVKGIIETQVIQALNNAPDAIEKLVKAALSKPVTPDGKFDGYGDKMPYMDYLVGQEIRAATTAAVRKVIQERAASIEEQVRTGLQADTIVAAVTKAIVGAAEQDWKINVSFVGEPKRSY